MTADVESVPGPSPARQSQKEATRQRVVAAARELFDTHGYQGASIREIARHAGVAVGSVFTTFASKADVLSQVMDDRVEALFSELDRVARHLRGSVIDRISSVFAIHYDFECRRVKLFLAHIAASYSPTLETTTIPYGRNSRFKGMLLTMMADGVERGEVRPDADLELVLDTLMAAYAWNYRLAAQRRSDALAMTALMERQVALIFDGLRP